ncbi:hypothetical protein [Mycolicibacterium sp. XJ1819]
MTDGSPAVTVGHPPAVLLRTINPMLRFALRTPLGGPLRRQFMVLTFTGRKSGRTFSIPVSAHRIDGQLYAIAEAAWKHNFRDGHEAQVVHDGKTTTMRGELITDPATVADLAHRLTQSYGVKRAQTMMGLKFREPRIPTVEEFTEASVREKIAAIRFTPA